MAIERGKLGTSPSSNREYGFLKATIAFWDTSENPETNDLEKKLGRWDATRGGAIVDFDKKTRRTTPADGFSNRKELCAARVLNPDGWVLRFLEEKGQGKKAYWDQRLIVDHSNYTTERDHRSTMVIDNRKKQRWAWLQNILSVVDMGVDVSHVELEISGSGFLNDLMEKVRGRQKRMNALAINMAGNAGYLTDQMNRVGQLMHIISLVPFGGQKGEQDHRSVLCEAALRGDVHFNFGSSCGQFVLDGDRSKDGSNYEEKRCVRFWLSLEPGKDLGQDAPNEPINQNPSLKRRPSLKILGTVRVPKGGGGDTKSDYSWHHVPPPKEGSGSGGGGGGSTTTGDAVGEGSRAPTASSVFDNPDGSGLDAEVDWGRIIDYETGGLYELNENGEYSPVTGEHFENHARQAQNGFPGWNSPGFSQRVNIFKHPDPGHERTHDTAQWQWFKPGGYRNIKIVTYIKVSSQISAGQTISMDLKIMPFNENKIPQYQTGIYGRQIVLDENTPYGIEGKYLAFPVYFTGFDEGPLQFSLWFERRSDLGTLDPDNDANVEVWVLSHTKELDMGK